LPRSIRTGEAERVERGQRLDGQRAGDDVATDHDQVDVRRDDLDEDRLQRRQVAVDVVEGRDAHRRSVPGPRGPGERSEAGQRLLLVPPRRLGQRRAMRLPEPGGEQAEGLARVVSSAVAASTRISATARRAARPTSCRSSGVAARSS
jgi:hypothetical protein